MENSNTQISQNERRGLVRKYHQVASEMSSLFPQELNSILTPSETNNFRLIQEALFPAHVTANPKVDQGKVILFAYSVIDIHSTHPNATEKSILGSQLLSGFAIRNLRTPRQLQYKRDRNKPLELPGVIDLSRDVYNCIDIFIESVSKHA